MMELDLEEAVFGIDREIRIPALAECAKCNGSGSADGKTSTCATCRGHGQVRMQNGIFSVQQACPHCSGTGKTITNPCTTCRGEGRVHDERTLQVKIPAGVDNGDRIRLAGQGEAGAPGGQAGDLHCEIPLRFAQAALGTQINVPTLDGESELEIPAETQSGRTIKLRGKGVKSVRSGRVGDLVCHVVVETPVKLTREQRDLLDQFDATFSGDRAEAHSPRTSSFLNGVKQFWDRVTS